VLERQLNLATRAVESPYPEQRKTWPNSPLSAVRERAWKIPTPAGRSKSAGRMTRE